jgi:amino acid transporter
MLKDASQPPERLGTGQPTPTELKSEVVWFPAAMMLLAFQVAALMRGFRVPLSFELQAAYLAGICLVALCVVLLLLAMARTSVLWRPFAMVSLVAGVAADLFVATSAATGRASDGLAMALVVVVAWVTVWSFTGSQSPL